MQELKSQHKLRHVEGSARLLESSLSFQDPDPSDMGGNFDLCNVVKEVASRDKLHNKEKPFCRLEAGQHVR